MRKRAPLFLLLLLLTTLPAMAGGLKGLGAAYDTLFNILIFIGLLFLIPPLWGVVKLLTRRPGERNYTLGVINLVVALPWLLLAKVQPVWALVTVAHIVIGGLLFRSRPPAAPAPPPPVAPSAPAAPSVGDGFYGPPAEVPPVRRRDWVLVVGIGVLSVIALVGLVVWQAQQPRSTTVSVIDGEIVLPEYAPPAPAPAAPPTDYATPAEVHAVAVERARQQRAADSLAQRRAEAAWDSPVPTDQ